VLLTAVLPWSRAIPHPRIAAHASEGLAEERSTRSWWYSSGAVSDMSAQCSADPHRIGNSGTVIGAGGRDASHVRCAAWWPTLADVVRLPLHATEWVAISVPVPSGGWAAAPVCRGGVSS
jgi:hypothetical protein